ncbi:MAG: GNAT family N-acetyltransferase [Bacilli bacterium]|nr:GNAT family N-acetyltransferase [Bacilli bacterium]
MTIKENYYNVEDYTELYKSVGWEPIALENAKVALLNSVYSVSIYDGEKAIGFGRMIGDQIRFLYICDIMVRPEYQGQGVGRIIMENIINRINEIKKIEPRATTYLGAVSGKEGFYEKFGFKTRREDGRGEGMVLH